MPVSAAAYEAYANEIRRIYAEAELQLLSKLARRVAAGIDTLDETAWLTRKMGEIRALQRELGGTVTSLNGFNNGIRQAITEAAKSGQAAADVDLRKLVGVLEPEVTTGSGAATRALATKYLSYADATIAKLQGMHFPILRSTEDIYRKVIYDAASQVTTGVLTRREATQAALNRFTKAGIKGFTDARGRQWQMASYAETAVRSATGQAALQGHFDKLSANGYDLVIVSSDAEPCDSCLPWEGKVLSMNGRTPGYPTVAEAMADSHLFGPNCGHNTGIYIEGVTREPELIPVEERQQAYMEKSAQRRIERDIRSWKLREAVAIGPRAQEIAAAKIAEQQARMREFIADTGRRRDYARESITRAR